ncbi:anti-phage ATPase IteA [Burkholderia gladioli]|uniref:anti-phage ATPase IteA n=1 Tax=Burkholderia gladioli TaxID=28095 RepID=UPI001FC86852|nr:anti-phage ATPase IteA [Burkholderia gladioli]
MEHMSEVLKILDGALRANVRMALDYAGLLAQKLEDEGSRDQARRIRDRLARAPQQFVTPQGALVGTLPVDQDSRLSTVDVLYPRIEDLDLVLPDAVEGRLREFIQSVRSFEKLAAAGVALPTRLLLHGPPGCGKTLSAQWIAANLELPLFTVRCDTLISSLLGQTSKNLRRVFDHIQTQPCVLFLDEFDALAKSRADEREIGELQRVVISLLQNIDSLPPNTVVIAATNHDQLLDSAVWRRFAFRIHFQLPDATLREGLWRRRLKTFAPKDINWSRLVTLSDGMSGAAIDFVAQDAMRNAVLSGEEFVTEAELLRRLGLTIAATQRVTLSNVQDEIRWLRQWQPSLFSQRALANLYKVSTRQIRNITGAFDGANGEPDTAGRFIGA